MTDLVSTDINNEVKAKIALEQAIYIITCHETAAEWYFAAIDAGYKIRPEKDLGAFAVHNPKCKTREIPQLLFSEEAATTTDLKQLALDYACALVHELEHFSKGKKGLFYDVGLSPDYDIKFRLMDEATAYTSTTHIIFEIGHGINTFSNTSFPELWNSHLKRSCIAKEYDKNYDYENQDPSKALKAAWNEFLNREAQSCYYQSVSLKFLCKESEETRANPKNFLYWYDTTKFIKYLSHPTNKLLAPLITEQQPSVVLRYDNAKIIEENFVKARLQHGGPRSVPWKLRVQDPFSDEIFVWNTEKMSLRDALIQPRSKAVVPYRNISTNLALKPAA